MVEPIANWRNDPGLQSTCAYKKRFAVFPVLCSDGSRIWMRSYYKKYEYWSQSPDVYEDGYLHTDFLENITEAEYIIRRLVEGV